MPLHTISVHNYLVETKTLLTDLRAECRMQCHARIAQGRRRDTLRMIGQFSSFTGAEVDKDVAGTLTGREYVIRTITTRKEDRLDAFWNTPGWRQGRKAKDSFDRMTKQDLRWPCSLRPTFFNTSRKCFPTALSVHQKINIATLGLYHAEGI